MWTWTHRRGNGWSRREALRVGALGMGGLSLADLLRLEAQEPPRTPPKSIIYVIHDGGPSHIDMYDLKPDAPSEYRGPFHPISTRLTGVQICELMPRQAAMMDQIALLRGVRSVENDHFLSEVYSGLARTQGRRPSFGSIVSRLAGNHHAMPTYVSLSRPTTDQFEFEKPYYAGSGHGPFRPFEESLNDLLPVRSLDLLRDRRSLLSAFDSARRDLDHSGAMAGMDRHSQRAIEIMTSPRVREAFDLSREPNRVIARYGGGKYTHQTVKDLVYDWDVKPFVLARRLVEAGVRVVTLRTPQWDHHSGASSDIFHSLRLMLPAVDQSLYGLFTDLRERGLDQDVLVVVLGEFGRTPRIGYPGPGREHWADAGCVLFFGGGLRMGQVIGETDSRAERSRSGSITFQNIFATIYQHLGIPLHTQLLDFNGRPQNLLNDPTPISELL